MNKRKSSKIWNIPREEFQLLLDNSNSYSEVLQKLNYDTKTGGAYKTLIKRITEEKFKVDKLNENREYKYKNVFIRKKSPIENILIPESNYSRNYLKKRLISENILEYKCFLCNIQNIWNGKVLSLQLDHINGINNDNRIENLRFLCPNCHSQTETYSGKKNKKQNNCLDCKTHISSKVERCKKCSSVENGIKFRKFEISKEELINLIKQYPMTKVGEILGVSDNAVRKRCKTLGIDYKNL